MTAKKTAKKTAPKRTPREPAVTAPEPMDPSIRETRTPEPYTNHPRSCWAIKTLVSEVEALFDGVTHETSNVNPRNTALDVTFDMSSLDGTDQAVLGSILELVRSDLRVEDVIVGGEDQSHQVLVSIRNDPRTQDSRDPFNIHEALTVMTEPSGDPSADFDAIFGGSL